MFKSRFITHLMVIVMAFSFTSCINIIEKIKLNKNGSGTYAMTIDMGRVAGMLQMMGQEGEGMNELMGSADSTFQVNKSKLENLEGISNVRFESSETKLTFTLLYDFDNVTALNKALWEYNKNQGSDEYIEFFSFDKKSFSRSNRDVLMESLTETMAGDEDMDFDPAMILGDMTYQIEIEFERGIKKVSNDAYEQLGKNTLKWKKYVFDKREEDKKIGVTVKLK